MRTLKTDVDRWHAKRKREKVLKKIAMPGSHRSNTAAIHAFRYDVYSEANLSSAVDHVEILDIPQNPGLFIMVRCEWSRAIRLRVEGTIWTNFSIWTNF